MTIPEITAYVMALPVEDVRRLTATEIMGWTLTMDAFGYDLYVDGDDIEYYVSQWRPDTDRNQSRQVTDKVNEAVGDEVYFCHGLQLVCGKEEWDSVWLITPDQESRAALIAHMIHAEESKNATN